METIKIKCACCDNGYIRMFSHIEGGICFTCEGKGYTEAEKTKETVKTLQKRALKAMHKILNIQYFLTSLTGYELDYKECCSTLNYEIKSFENILEDIKKSTSADFITELWIKAADCY